MRTANYFNLSLIIYKGIYQITVQVIITYICFIEINDGHH